jgi:hypothetical protein
MAKFDAHLILRLAAERALQVGIELGHRAGEGCGALVGTSGVGGLRARNSRIDVIPRFVSRP